MHHILSLVPRQCKCALWKTQNIHYKCKVLSTGVEIVESARLPGWHTRSNCLSRYHLPLHPFPWRALLSTSYFYEPFSFGQQSPFPTFAPSISSMVKINTDQGGTGGESGFAIKPIILLDSAVLLLLSHPRCPIPTHLMCVEQNWVPSTQTPPHTKPSIHALHICYECTQHDITSQWKKLTQPCIW